MTNQNVPYRAKIEYDEAKSELYDNRSERRNKPEMALLGEALKILPAGSSVLDAPCGPGRVSQRLAEMGMQVTSVDISDPMIERTRSKMAHFSMAERVSKGDLEKLVFPDRAFDATVCFRFFHHLPNETLRRQVISELCRVTKQHVIISFYHPVSLHNLKRMFQIKVLGKSQRRFHLRPHELAALFAEQGFQPVEITAERKYLSTLWLGVFKRS
jgi:ubiquinone/menaquinone biosynthesis C-methylase UbiE